MAIRPGNAQHIGTRQEQQDDFGFSDQVDQALVEHGGVLAVLTDGMGGLALGREAGRIAKLTMLQEYEAKVPQESIPEALLRALKAANQAVWDLSRQADQEGMVGTTLAAAVVRDGRLFWVSVGDSRMYLYRQGNLVQLTTDHDYGQELAKMAAAGEMSPEDALNHPQRRALTSYLGLPQLREVDCNLHPYPLELGDRLLLCSDGLYGALGDEEIVQSLSGDPQEAAQLLVDRVMAKNKEHQDNVTVAILAWDGEGAPLPPTMYRQEYRSGGWTWPKVTLLAVVLLSAGLGGVGTYFYWQAAEPAALGGGFKAEPGEPAGDGKVSAPPQALSPGGGSTEKPPGEGSKQEGQGVQAGTGQEVKKSPAEAQEPGKQPEGAPKGKEPEGVKKLSPGQPGAVGEHKDKIGQEGKGKERQTEGVPGVPVGSVPPATGGAPKIEEVTPAPPQPSPPPQKAAPLGAGFKELKKPGKKKKGTIPSGKSQKKRPTGKNGKKEPS